MSDPFKALSSLLSDAVFEAKADGEIVRANGPLVQMLRLVPGDDWRQRVFEQDRALVDSFWNSIFVNADDLHQPISFRLGNTRQRVQLRAQSITSDDSTQLPQSAVAVLLDESSAPGHRWEVDSITGLPDRQAVVERISSLIEAQEPFATALVLLSEEDRTNDLRRKEAARALLDALRPDDVVACALDGHFVVCASHVTYPTPVMRVAERLLKSLADSGIVAQIGVALPENETAPATLLRAAEAGAHEASPGSVVYVGDAISE